MKKFLTYSVVAATIAWSMGISAVLPAAAAYSATDGDVIKVAAKDRPAVYYISGGKKYLMVNRVTYSTWASAIGDTADNFTGLKAISQADFDAISTGGNITVRPGTSLIKFDDSSVVYAVGTGAKLYKLADSAAQTALYGSITPIIIQSGFRSNYYDNGNSVATLTSTSLYPSGTLIKASTGDTYLVDGTNKRTVSTDAFTANGFKSTNVRTVTDLTAYGTGTALTSKESAVASPVSGASSSVVTGSATVSLAADTPASGTVVASQATADLAHFTFTGTGTVTGLKLTKIGIAGDTTLSNIYLYDGATRLTDAGSFSNGTVNFSNGSGIFTINGTKVITVKSDILTGTGGQTVGVAINAAADVTGSTVSGSFPVKGNIMSIASAPSDIVTATLGGGASITSVGTSVTAGTSNVSLWNDTLSIAQRTTYLKGFTVNQIGSMTNDSITNINLYVDGSKVASGSIDANGLLVFSLMANPVSLNTGSHTLEIRGDVIKGSSRTFKMSLRNASDLVLTDSSYGVNIAASLASGSFPAEPTSGSTTISSGTLSISTDPSFNTTQIVSSASGQTLGKWIFKAYGEDMKVMNLYASSTGLTSIEVGTSEKINNYSIFVNGAQVGSSKTYQLSTSTSLFTGMTEFGSTNLFVIPAGTAVTVEIRGDLSLDSSTHITGVMSAIKLVSGQVQGQTSFATTAIAADTTYAALNTLTIATGVLSAAANSAYGNQTIAPNTTGAKIGSFILTAGNADTVHVSNINIGWGSATTLGYATNTSNLYISDNTGKVSAQSSNNFAVDFTMQPNTTHQVDVYADIGNLSAADLGLLLQTKITATARTGSNADASITTAKNGQTITVNSGTLSSVTFATSSALTSRYVLGGSTQDKEAVYTIKATGAPIILDEMAFFVTSTPNVNPITSLIVYPEGSSQSWTLSINDNYGTTTGMNLTIPNSYAGQKIMVKAVFAGVGEGKPLTTGGAQASSSLTYIKYREGSTIKTAYYADRMISPQYVVVSSMPTVTVSKVSNLLSVGTVKLANLNLSADSAGPVNITQIKLAVTSSSKVTITPLTLKLKDSGGTVVSDSVSATNGVATFTPLNGGYTVNAGQPVTLYVYGDIAALSAWGNAGTEYVTVGLDTASGFVWDDVNGNKTGLTGTQLYGYSTDAVNITN